MTLVQLSDTKTRIKLGVAAALGVVALVIGLRGVIFGSSAEPVDIAGVEAGSAVVAEMQAQRVSPPQPSADEMAAEPGSGKAAQPMR